MKVYTKTGDAGTTRFIGGERVAKNDLRIKVLGALDELNSILGLVTSFIDENEIRETVVKVQHDLFTLGAEIAAMSAENAVKIPKILPEHIEQIERLIDEIDGELAMPNSFVLPNGTQSSCFLHFARTTTRRVERLVVALARKVELRPEILQYMNRLSDLLYVLARKANKEFKIKEQQPIYRYMEDKKEWKN